jgi:hypothetical protein
VAEEELDLIQFAASEVAETGAGTDRTRRIDSHRRLQSRTSDAHDRGVTSREPIVVIGGSASR